MYDSFLTYKNYYLNFIKKAEAFVKKIFLSGKRWDS